MLSDPRFKPPNHDSVNLRLHLVKVAWFRAAKPQLVLSISKPKHTDHDLFLGPQNAQLGPCFSALNAATYGQQDLLSISQLQHWLYKPGFKALMLYRTQSLPEAPKMQDLVSLCEPKPGWVTLGFKVQKHSAWSLFLRP